MDDDEGGPWAIKTAERIVAKRYPNMSVTYSPEPEGGEYTQSVDVLLPLTINPEPVMDLDWRVANSLLTLRDQVNAKWPNRDKSNDGTIGNASHAATTSDHNPNAADVVTAMDITNDPAHGLVARALAETLVASRDPRIKYIISNAQIISAKVSPWIWRPYTGSNAHREHVHISVDGDPALYDDPRSWNLGGAVVQPPPVKPSDQFNKCIPLLLVSEGGNDDDPEDPGGRTSRGIIQSEWDKWRTTHPGLPADVWQAPQDQVIAIYRQQYWNALRCDELPHGVDYAVFDYGVNSGIGKSAKVLQGLVGATADGVVGKNTLAAVAKADSARLINQICDQRMAYLKGLSTWSRFGKGWAARVTRVRADALAMTGGVAQPPPIDDVHAALAELRATVKSHEDRITALEQKKSPKRVRAKSKPKP